MTASSSTSARRLVILSVPYLRAARVLLIPPVLDAIAGYADILVVGPFAGDKSFQRQFTNFSADFLEFDADQKIAQPFRAFYSFSEMLRMNGFWFRYRHNGLGYHWAISGLDFGNGGANLRKPLTRWIATRVGGVLGRWCNAWRVIDRLIGPAVFRFDELVDRLYSYDLVTVVQASSWGFQDRMLAWQARAAGMRTVLLPYTTDQLWVNGYLLSDYNVVCAQGPFEARCAREYHDVPEHRIERLGSMWFRNMDALRARIAERQSSDPQRPRRILYAGLSNQFFARENEYSALAALLQAGKEGRLGRFELIYRPYAFDSDERREIERRISDFKSVELQWPEEACAGFDSYEGFLVEPQLLQYVARLSHIDVVVMSHTTSLGWDAAYLGSSLVANFTELADEAGHRHIGLRFVPGSGLNGAPGLPLARTLDELVGLVVSQLTDQAEARASVAGILRNWDFSASNVSERLRRAIFGFEAEDIESNVPVLLEPHVTR